MVCDRVCSRLEQTNQLNNGTKTSHFAPFLDQLGVKLLRTKNSATLEEIRDSYKALRKYAATAQR